jgi:glutamate dehydrogenase/leucine dehydrogenase
MFLNMIFLLIPERTKSNFIGSWWRQWQPYIDFFLDFTENLLIGAKKILQPRKDFFKGVLNANKRTCKALLERNGEEAHVVVQRCGNMGGIAIQYFNKAGAKGIAISNSKGGVYSEKGLNISAVMDCEKRYSCLITPGARGGEEITNEDSSERPES